MIKKTTVLLDTSMCDLAVWLQENEQNIAYDIAYDLGDLKDVFYDVFGRYPAKTEQGKLADLDEK